MPRPRGVKRRRVKEHERKQRKKMSSKALVLGGFPKSKLVKLRYVQIFTLNATSVAPAVQVFRANSLYDPDQTGTGHQPANFDRWTNVYDHYTVIGAKITAKFLPNSGSNVNPAIMGIALSDGGTSVAGSSTEDILERKLTASNKDSVGIINAYQGLKPVSAFFSASKFFGKPNSSIIGDGQYKGKMGNTGTGSNPTEGAFFEVFATAIDNEPGAMKCIATVDYVAVLTEPKPDEAS